MNKEESTVPLFRSEHLLTGTFGGSSIARYWKGKTKPELVPDGVVFETVTETNTLPMSSHGKSVRCSKAAGPPQVRGNPLRWTRRSPFGVGASYRTACNIIQTNRDESSRVVGYPKQQQNNPNGPHRLHAGVLEHLRKVFHSPGPTGRDHRDRHRSHDSLGKKNGHTQGKDRIGGALSRRFQGAS